MFIDKDQFPKEYNAIQRLKSASAYYEKERKKRREEKQRKLEEIRRTKHSK